MSLNNESPKGRIENAFEVDDYHSIATELRKFDTNLITDYEKQISFRNEMNELENGEELANEPYEKARKISLIVDGISQLAHAYDSGHRNGNGMCERYNSFLMNMKDYFMSKLVIYCVENGMVVGHDKALDDKGKLGRTLEIDIPEVGHVGWHYGTEFNFQTQYGDIDKELKYMGISQGFKQYPYDVQPKVIKDPINGYQTYSNQTLLMGMLTSKQFPYISEADRSLILDGKISPSLISGEKNDYIEYE